MKNYYYNSIEEFLELNTMKEKICLLLIAEECSFNFAMLEASTTRCYGAVFPEIIYSNQHYKKGLIAIELEEEPLLIEDMKANVLKNTTLGGIESMLVFVDGLSTSIDSFLFSLFEVIDEDCVLFGGGAGKLTFEQEKVIFTPNGMYQDSALIIPFKKEIRVGVNHGWEFLEGPLVVTSSEKNILKKIDYEDAYKVYKRIVEEDSGLLLSKDNFFELSKSYPLGIVTIDDELLVRDPILVQDNALVLVGDMPDNSVINILKGSKPHLIESAKKAAQEAYDNTLNNEMVFMVDCISRVLFLEDSFKDEIGSVNEIIEGTPLVGVLTLGEIANNSKSYIEFYNKTCVVGVICS